MNYPYFRSNKLEENDIKAGSIILWISLTILKLNVHLLVYNYQIFPIFKTNPGKTGSQLTVSGFSKHSSICPGR